MKVKVLKGTNQIGGCITEITSDKGIKILVDFGEDLNDEEVIKINEDFDQGLIFEKEDYKAVFITHSHGDHIGLISKIKKDVPIYIEEVSSKIFEISNSFSSNESFKGKITTFQFGDEIMIDDLRVVAYQTDHSAYHSSMFLIENGSKRILHMGDYRANGYSFRTFYHNLRKIRKKGRIDLLITEGTSVNRDDIVNVSEAKLQKEAIKLFRQYKQVFILQASTNLDRVRTFYEASKGTGKKFIVDVATANLLKEIEDKRFNFLEDQDVSVWVSNAYMNEYSRFYEFKEKDFYEKYIKYFKNKFKRCNENMHGEYVMLVKTSMLSDIKVNLAKYRDNACLIYSMWNGYRDPKRKNTEKTIRFLDSIRDLGIEVKYLHTSGHADIKTMRRVNRILEAKKTIGIHTTANEKLGEIFDGYENLVDNMEVEI